MAQQAIKDVLRYGLSPTIDKYLGGDSAYEESPENRSQQPTSGDGYQDQLYRPVDATPGEVTPQLIAGVDDRVTYAGGAVVLAVGLFLLVKAVK